MQSAQGFPRAPQTSANTNPVWGGEIVLVAAGTARCSSLLSQMGDSKVATLGDAGLGALQSDFQVLQQTGWEVQLAAWAPLLCGTLKTPW